MRCLAKFKRQELIFDMLLDAHHTHRAYKGAAGKTKYFDVFHGVLLSS
jgi:hypothetical protein